MKVEVFCGTPDDPTTRDKFHFIAWPDWAGEDRVRTKSNRLLRIYRGMFYFGRARSMAHARDCAARRRSDLLAQYPVVRHDVADDLADLKEL